MVMLVKHPCSTSALFTSGGNGNEWGAFRVRAYAAFSWARKIVWRDAWTCSQIPVRNKAMISFFFFSLSFLVGSGLWSERGGGRVGSE